MIQQFPNGQTRIWPSRFKGVTMASNNLQKKKSCPHCQALAIFDEIHTYQKLATGQPKVKVVVFRCPECKKITGPIIPLNQQSE